MSQPDARRVVNLLLDDLLTVQDRLTAEIVGHMRDRLSTYRALNSEDFEKDVDRALDTLILLSRENPPRLEEKQRLALERIGYSQARLGVPVDQLLMAWRIGADVLLSHGIAKSGDFDIFDGRLIGFIQGTLAASDVGMATTARAHREDELRRDREEQGRRTAFVRALLYGNSDARTLRAQAAGYGIDTSCRYRAIRAQPAEGSPATSVVRAVGLEEADYSRRGMYLPLDDGVAGFQIDEPGDAAPGLAGYGPPVRFEQLSRSFTFATRAYLAMRSYRMAGTRDVPTLGLRTAVASDPDMGETLRLRYLEPLNTSASRDETIETLKAYLAANFHVETAAEHLHIHPNTLRYRLARFEDLTGTHLRDHLTSFELWWAIESLRLVEPS